MFKRIFTSPIFVRVGPFAVFAALTMLQGHLGENSQYWLYALKTIIGAWMLWLVRPYIKEMRWKFSWEAAVVGIAIFAIWVGLDGYYPLLAQRTESFNPEHTYGAGSALAIFFIVVRMIGSSLVVPPLEEVFYRSFLYRYLIKSDFLSVPLNRLDWRAFLIGGAIFGVSHYEWIPGILCAFAYQGLVIRTNRLGDAITAHAVTNFLLGLWIITRHAYCFW
jgi:CAAX prenyl protease-like protein